MNTRQRITERDMQAVATAVTAAFRTEGVRVICQGQEACTDGKNIYLPDMNYERVDYDTLQLIRTYLFHELGHIVGNSDVPLLQDIGAKEGVAGATVMNVLEDRRIEALINDRLIGTGLAFSSGYQQIIDSEVAVHAKKGEPPSVFRQFTMAIYSIFRPDRRVPSYVEQPVLDLLAPHETELRSMCNFFMQESGTQAQPWADSTRSLLPLWDTLLKLWKNFAADQQQKQEQQQGQQDQPNGNDDSGGDGSDSSTHQPQAQPPKPKPTAQREEQSEDEGDDKVGDDDEGDNRDDVEGSDEPDNTGDEEQAEAGEGEGGTEDMVDEESDASDASDDEQGDDGGEDLPPTGPDGSDGEEGSGAAGGAGLDGEGECDSEGEGAGSGEDGSEGTPVGGDSRGRDDLHSADDLEVEETSPAMDGGRDAGKSDSKGAPSRDVATNPLPPGTVSGSLAIDESELVGVGESLAQRLEEKVEESKGFATRDLMEVVKNYDVMTPDQDQVDDILKGLGGRYDNSDACGELKQLLDTTSAAAKQRIVQVLLSEARTGWRGNRTRGLPNPSQLYQVATGTSSRVMRRRYNTAAPDTAVCILLDASGSMSHLIDMAATTSAVIADAVEMAGHKAMCVSFTDPVYEWNHDRQAQMAKQTVVHPARVHRSHSISLLIWKPWDKKVRACLPQINAARWWESGSTPMFEAMMRTYKLFLASRTEKRKILLVVGDGGPNEGSGWIGNHAINWDKLRGYKDTRDIVKTGAALLESLGVEVGMIGIQTNAMTEIHHRSCRINNVKDLGTAAAGELIEMLRKGMVQAK
jgi:cobalamin biosynthesis protein CobT